MESTIGSFEASCRTCVLVVMNLHMVVHKYNLTAEIDGIRIMILFHNVSSCENEWHTRECISMILKHVW